MDPLHQLQRSHRHASTPVLIDPEDLLNLLEPVADIVANISMISTQDEMRHSEWQEKLVEEADRRLVSQIRQALGVPLAVRQGLIRRVIRVRRQGSGSAQGSQVSPASSALSKGTPPPA